MCHVNQDFSYLHRQKGLPVLAEVPRHARIGGVWLQLHEGPGRRGSENHGPTGVPLRTSMWQTRENSEQARPLSSQSLRSEVVGAMLTEEMAVGRRNVGRVVKREFINTK